jgi:hypothetical protein
VFTTSGLRDRDAVAANRPGQRSLWPHAISGDLPIVLARVTQDDDEAVVRQLVRWRSYIVRRRLKFDLVILDERADEPAERLRKELETGVAAEMLGKAGRSVRAGRASPAGRRCRAARGRSARGAGGGRGSLIEQIERDGDRTPSWRRSLRRARGKAGGAADRPA